MQIVKFIYSIRYTKPKQIYYRIKYIIRRKIRSQFSHIYSMRLIKNNSEIKVNQTLPLTAFPKKQKLIIKGKDVFKITFLNYTREFILPFNWHHPELAHGTRLWKLNLHYMEYLEDEDLTDDDFCKIIDDWIIQNPPYMKDYGLDNWNSYALSIRTIIWMQQYVLREKQFSSEFKIVLLKSLYRQITFLYDNIELDIGGNHLIKNIKTLLWAGEFFNTDESGKWKKMGEELLKEQLKEQILSDGVHFELSPSYHCQVFADLIDCYIVLNNKEVKNILYKKLNEMAQAIADLSFSDGEVGLFNDSAFNMTFSPEVCLSVWQKLSGKLFNKQEIFSYKQSGYYGIHNGNYEIIYDAGKIGPDYLTAHSHGDIFSFELALKGKRFIIDTGVFEYNSGSKRNYSRSTKAHNTVTIVDKDQCEFYGAFRTARRAKVHIHDYCTFENGFSLTASHNGYSRLTGDPVHQRKFTVKDNHITIIDSVKNGNKQKVKSRLLIHPHCSIQSNGDTVILTRDESYLKIYIHHNYEIKPALYFPEFGKEIKCNQIEIEYGYAQCEGNIEIEIGDVDSEIISALLEEDFNKNIVSFRDK